LIIHRLLITPPNISIQKTSLNNQLKKNCSRFFAHYAEISVQITGNIFIIMDEVILNNIENTGNFEQSAKDNIWV
jgi:hypothetical protein